MLCTYHSDMNVFLEEFTVGSQRRALVVARVVSAGHLYIESSAVLKILDSSEIPAIGAPPDLTWYVELA